MNYIVDANIVFNGILNTNSTIADLLINSHSFFSFIAPEFLRKEIRKHYPRLKSISGFTSRQIQEAEHYVCKQITFASLEQIPETVWVEAWKLTADVDPKDVVYIALAKYFHCKLWSGDKQLARGLAKKGYIDIITTKELFHLRSTLSAKQRN
ncbi:MAG: PIN domain-containing protein [Bacteroidota bacterium]